MRARSPHACPHCRCTWNTRDDMGEINTNAPGYPLVMLIDSLSGQRNGGKPTKKEDST